MIQHMKIKVIDSDCELQPEYDEVLFISNVEGNPGKVNEYEDMGYAWNITNGIGEDSERFDTVSESSSSGDEVVRLKGRGSEKKRFSKWRKFNREIDL